MSSSPLCQLECGMWLLGKSEWKPPSQFQFADWGSEWRSSSLHQLLDRCLCTAPTRLRGRKMDACSLMSLDYNGWHAVWQQINRIFSPDFLPSCSFRNFYFLPGWVSSRTLLTGNRGTREFQRTRPCKLIYIIKRQDSCLAGGWVRESLVRIEGCLQKPLLWVYQAQRLKKIKKVLTFLKNCYNFDFLILFSFFTCCIPLIFLNFLLNSKKDPFDFSSKSQVKIWIAF